MQVVPALHTYDSHSGVVEDVAWHGIHPDIFASVGDDKKLMIWDLREKLPRGTTEAHSAEVNCVQARPPQPGDAAAAAGVTALFLRYCAFRCAASQDEQDRLSAPAERRSSMLLSCAADPLS
jgi:WD40 repeat protein